MFRTFIFGMMSVALLSGCGTLQNLDDQRTPYGGFVYDIDYAIHGAGYMEDMTAQPLCALDAPFSFAADTVTLPITIVESVKQVVTQRRERETKE